MIRCYCLDCGRRIDCEGAELCAICDAVYDPVYIAETRAAQLEQRARDEEADDVKAN